jgi:hypothetical protein
MKSHYETLPDVPPRDDYVALQATGRNCDGREIAVIVHVLRGRLYELEVWTSDTKRTETDIPAVAMLRRWESTRRHKPR